MSYKLQLIGCTKTVHTHNGNHVTNLSHSPTSPLTLRTTQLHTQTHYLLLLTQPKTDSLCILTNLYRSRLCDITNSHFLCILTKKCLSISLLVRTSLTHFVTNSDPSIFIFEFLFFIITFFIIL